MTNMILWDTLTGSQIRAIVKAKQAEAKGKSVPKAVKEKLPEVVKPEKKATKKTKPAAKRAAPPIKTVSRGSTTEKRIRAMSWILENGLPSVDKTEAISKIVAEFDVPKNYAADWLKRALAAK